MVHFAKDTNYFDRDYFAKIRTQYMFDLADRGVTLIEVAPTWAKTRRGLWVALPAASERKDEHWWLGLNNQLAVEKIQVGGLAVILLCVTKDEVLLDFVLDPEIFAELRPRLSRSGQELKFNVKELDRRYVLTIPQYRLVEITQYKGKVDILRL